MKPTVRRLSRLALLAIFCFGVALGVGAYLLPSSLQWKPAAAMIWAAWTK
jgi:hypothetical protein